MKHTPGPWCRDPYGFVSSEEGHTIACFDQTKDIDIGEREANKNLAIAGPGLLAALESLMPLWERDDVANTYAKEFEAAEKAIAQAREVT